jgi:hypothetical protein
MQNIQDTGVRGYLKWLQQDQPGLYTRVAPLIAQRVPEAFTDYEQSMAQGALMGFAQDGGAAPGVTTYFGDSTDSFNPSAGASSTGTTTTTTTPATPDVASAANSGAASPSIISAITGLVSTAAQVFLGDQQLNALMAVNQAQLTRAAAGLPPLATSTGALGVPTIGGISATTAATTGGTLLLGLAAIVGIGWLLSRHGHKSAPA